MFGENFILGTGVGKLDEKGRFIVPSFTGAEKNDEIVLEKIKLD